LPKTWIEWGFVLVVRVGFWLISAIFCCWPSGGRSRLAAAGLVIAFSWMCVGAVGVCVVVYFFIFLVTTLQG
ncbi:Os06g0579100, partial [Oryza sativa Japonica Group]